MKNASLFVLLAILTLTGCETVKGMGQDIENTGENVQEAVENIIPGEAQAPAEEPAP